MIGQAILLGCIAFIAQSEYALGTSLLSRPIVTGLFVGICFRNLVGLILGSHYVLGYIADSTKPSVPLVAYAPST